MTQASTDYTSIALAFHPTPHREVSLALAAKSLGAVKAKPRATALADRSSAVEPSVASGKRGRRTGSSTVAEHDAVADTDAPETTFNTGSGNAVHSVV